MFREESNSYQDLVARIDALEPLECLSLLAHPWWAEERYMSFMICSYADESGDKQVYSVCGLLGKLSNFIDLGRSWRAALQAEGLTEFHAAKLENHWEPYDDTSVFTRDRIDYLQRKFIGLITSRRIWGFNAFVENAALKAHEAELLPFMPHLAPYTFAFRMFVEIVALEIDDYKKKDEPIAFVFDQQKQYQGKAKEMYDELASEGEWPLAHRLGSLGFESRLTHVELQAADCWAYESRKRVSDVVYHNGTERWQMTLFRDAGRFNIKGYPEKQLQDLIARLA